MAFPPPFALSAGRRPESKGRDCERPSGDVALRLRGLRPLRSARTDFPPPFALGAGRRNGFPTTVRPERRPKAGVEGPGLRTTIWRSGAATPGPPAGALSAYGFHITGCSGRRPEEWLSHHRSP